MGAFDLVQVTERPSLGGAATKTTPYKYDVFNRLVGRSVDDDGDGPHSAHSRYFAYDGDHPVLELNGGIQHRYLYGPAVDQVLAQEDDTGDVRWLLPDHQGTIRDVAEYNATTDTTTVINHLQEIKGTGAYIGISA